MSTEQKLREALNDCFSDWGDFDIDIGNEDSGRSYDYFHVIVSHAHIGQDYEFTARVSHDLEVVEASLSDEGWELINKGTMFSWMWFETAPIRTKKLTVV